MRAWRRAFKGFPIEFLFPLLLSVAITVALSSVLYSGGKRESLASLVETQLLESVIRFAERPASNIGSTIVVTLKDDEISQFSLSPSQQVRDAHIDVYGRVAKSLLLEGAELVVLSPLAAAHPNDPEYWSDFAGSMDPLFSNRVILAYPLGEASLLPKPVQLKFLVKEGEDCVYRVNSYCSFNPEWTSWFIQYLAERFWTKPKTDELSRNLPHVIPNFILNLPAADSIPQTGFSGVLKNEGADLDFRNAAVFVGNDVTQSQLFADNKRILRKTFTPTSVGRRHLMRDGEPLPLFWARLVQMFVDDRTVSVASWPVIVTIMIIGGATLVVSMLLGGVAVALIVLLLAMGSLVAANHIGVRNFHYYIPSFNIEYIFLITFLFAAFGFMSFSIFRRRRLEAFHASLKATADLKENFISLISHNLNTPIAQLSGLVDVLIQAKELEAAKDLLIDVRAGVTKLLVLVRSVLLRTAIEQRSVSMAPVAVSDIINEFEETLGRSLGKSGITVHWEKRSGVEQSKVQGDLRLFSHAIGVMLALLTGVRRAAVQLELGKDEDGNVVFSASQIDGLESEQKIGEFHPGEGGGFVRESLETYLHSLSGLYGSSIELGNSKYSMVVRPV